jgi:hypothetical protein
MPDTIPYANHWLSVQVYYALYLALRAYLLACSDKNIADSHEAAPRNFTAEVMSRPALFVIPWSLVAVGDPADPTPILENCPKQLRAINPLTRPVGDNIWNLTACFLRTTRKRRLDLAIDSWKLRNKRLRIRGDQRNTILKSLRPTNMMDALYRLRVKANYEEADFHLMGSISDQDARSFFDSNILLLKSGLLNFELLVARHVGRSVYERIVVDFVKKERKRFSEGTVIPRWTMIEKII